MFHATDERDATMDKFEETVAHLAFECDELRG